MKIRTKNPKFTGVRAGIAFVNGEGETSDEKIVGQLRRLGYAVEDGSQDGQGTDGEQGNGAPAGNASRDDWALHAESLGLVVPEDAKRDDIKALVEGAGEQDS